MLNSESNPYQAYKFLLVQNILASYEKSHYQESKKDLQRCFSLENQPNKLEVSIIYNLCSSVLYYKKNEIKKLFSTIEETFIKCTSQECNLAIFREVIKEEYTISLLKKFVIKEIILKKSNLVQGLYLEEFLYENNIWLSSRHNLSLFMNIIFSLLILQKNPIINSIHKNAFNQWQDKFKVYLSKCNCGKILIILFYFIY
jgi:hypothetical protein